MHQFGLFPFFMPNIFGNIMKFAIGECKKEVVFSAPKNRKKYPHCLLMIEDSYPLFLKFLTLSRTLIIIILIDCSKRCTSWIANSIGPMVIRIWCAIANIYHGGVIP